MALSQNIYLWWTVLVPPCQGLIVSLMVMRFSIYFLNLSHWWSHLLNLGHLFSTIEAWFGFQVAVNWLLDCPENFSWQMVSTMCMHPLSQLSTFVCSNHARLRCSHLLYVFVYFCFIVADVPFFNVVKSMSKYSFSRIISSFFSFHIHVINWWHMEFILLWLYMLCSITTRESL